MSPQWTLRRSSEQHRPRPTHSGTKYATPSGNYTSRRMDLSRTASLTPLGLKPFNILINKRFNTYFNRVHPAHSFFCYSKSNIIDEVDIARDGIGIKEPQLDKIGKMGHTTGAIGDTSQTEKRVGTYLGYHPQDIPGTHAASI